MNANPSRTLNSIATRALKQVVIGVGGAGGNIAAHLNRQQLADVEILAINTDAQALAGLSLPQCHVIGEQSMRGLGAGGDPECGQQAAEESLELIRPHLEGCDILYIVAGMGGGTGTGAAPVVARLGREAGALVLGLVTLPFDFEGERRRAQAVAGVSALRGEADGVIVVPNQKILSITPNNAPLPECFDLIHDYLHQGIQGVVKLINEPGTVNVDFADLRAVIRTSSGFNALANVQSTGMNHVDELMDRLIQHPLLDEGQVLMAANNILVSVHCGPDVSLQEINNIMTELQEKAPAANINFGFAIQQGMPGQVSLTLVLGLEGEDQPADVPETPAPKKARGRAGKGAEIGEVFVDQSKAAVPNRFVPPPPSLSPEEATKIMLKESGRSMNSKRRTNKILQGQLPLEIVSTGRFEKSEPTLHHGENLDEPTYIRRGVVLN